MKAQSAHLIGLNKYTSINLLMDSTASPLKVITSSILASIRPMTGFVGLRLLRWAGVGKPSAKSVTPPLCAPEVTRKGCAGDSPMSGESRLEGSQDKSGLTSATYSLRILLVVG